MLQSISWFQFFSTIAGTAALYYLGIVLYFYSHEFKLLLRGEFQQVKGSANSEKAFTGDLMGQTKRVSQAPNSTSDETDDALLGTVSDLIEEIKNPINATESLTRDKLKPLFQPLLAKYPSLLGTHYQQTISLFIADAITDKEGYLVERDDVLSWWLSSSPSEIKRNN